MSDLDKDFEQVAEQINAKIQEAVVALKEANRLRKDAGLEALIYSSWTGDNLDTDEREALQEKLSKIDVDALEGEMEQAGWSMSSSYC